MSNKLRKTTTKNTTLSEQF